MLEAIVMIVAGLLAAPKLIMGKNKHAEDLLKKIAPYQGWIGFVIFFWGIWGIIQSVLNLGWLSVKPIWWITYLAVAVLEVIIGLLLGFNLINKYVLSKNAQSQEKGEMIHKKLVPKQTTFGILGIIVGAWMLIYFLVWY